MLAFLRPSSNLLSVVVIGVSISSNSLINSFASSGLKFSLLILEAYFSNLSIYATNYLSYVAADSSSFMHSLSV